MRGLLTMTKPAIASMHHCMGSIALGSMPSIPTVTVHGRSIRYDSSHIPNFSESKDDHFVLYTLEITD